MTMARGTLVSIIISKVLAMSSVVSAKKGSGTLTLMSTDVDNISKPPPSVSLSGSISTHPAPQISFCEDFLTSGCRDRQRLRDHE